MNPQLACPSRGELSAFFYLSGEISPMRQDEIGEHLAHCAACLETLDRCNAEDTSRNADTLLSLGPADADAAPVLSEPECRQMIAAAQEIQVDSQENGDQLSLVPPRRREQRSLPAALGPYELLGRVGEGGMGAVYKARHKRLERIVALKIIAEHRVADSQSLERFFREWIALAKLQHKNIVQAIDAGDDADFHFLVMEHVDGIDLAKLVRRGGRLKVADACEVIRQAAVGLEYVHDQGLVHRDIKPSNLMIDSAGQVKILDLGLAVWQNDDHDRSGLTVDQQILGTVDYMAPEQAFDSHRAEIQADIYSLGCTLYFLLSGHAPFSSAEYSGTMKKLLAHSQAPRPSIGGERGDVPPRLDALVRRMIAKSPADRPASPGKVARELERFTAGSDLERLARGESTSNLDAGIAATPAVGPVRRTLTAPIRAIAVLPRLSRRATFVLAAFIVTAALLLAFFFTSKNRSPNIDEPTKSLPSLTLVGQEFSASDGWQNLLFKKPTVLVFELPDNVAAWWDFDPNSGHVRFNSPGRLLLQLGTTTAPNYEFLATFNQTPWTGNIGLFLGCHAIASGVQRYQFVWLGRIRPRKPFDPTQFMVTRSFEKIIGNEEAHSTNSPSSEDLKASPQPDKNHTLRLVVRNSRLVEVWFDAEKLPNLVHDPASNLLLEDAAKHELSVADNAGGFGIFGDTTSATVLDARFRILKGEHAHGR